jgi:hypothetical protein
MRLQLLEMASAGVIGIASVPRLQEYELTNILPFFHH